ncbi:MAG: PhoD-like phosphatase N-terminal domain-containing protein, partial [Pseudomonadales bacterium]
MTLPLTRRALVQGLAAGTLLPWWSARSLAAARKTQGVFGHGVASGDPTEDSVVLWTRLEPSAGVNAVRWELAEDAAFQRRVLSDTQKTG